MPEIRLKFDRHGLGDVVHAAHLLQLYRRDGYSITLQGEPNKRLVWEAAGVNLTDEEGLPDHNWGYPHEFENLSEPDWLGNKAAHGIGHAPLPALQGTRQELWDDLCAVRLSVDPLIEQRAKDDAERFIAGLPRPIICLHASGTNWRERKSLPPETSFALILELIRRTEGSVISLDWDHRDPIPSHPSCKPIWPTWGKLDLHQLAALYGVCDLMIGIDSGPFHFAAMTDIPALGVFRSLHPVRCCLPSPRAEYLVSADYETEWEKRLDRWNLRMYAGDEPTAGDIASVATSLINGEPRERFLPPDVAAQKKFAGKYLYQRVGHDTRMLILEPSGAIGEGSARCERRWRLCRDNGVPVIEISGESGVICACRQNRGEFLGQWTRYEKMPIRLVRIDPKTDTASADKADRAVEFYLDLIGESEETVQLQADQTVTGSELVDGWESDENTLTLNKEKSAVCVLRRDGDGCLRGFIQGGQVEMIEAARQPFRSVGPAAAVEYRENLYRYTTLEEFRRAAVSLARKLPPIKAVAGVPRSGLMAASLIALELNSPMVPIESLFARHLPTVDVPRRGRGPRYHSEGIFLVVDDNCNSGRVIRRLREKLNPAVKIAAIEGGPPADFWELDMIRDVHQSHEWTLFHDDNAEFTLTDMDGVLCEDWHGGSETGNSEAYLDFLNDAKPNRIPSYPLLAIVTNRLEKHRPETERWLERHGVRYGTLIMSPHEDFLQRDYAGDAATRKAEAYRQHPEARLFVESCDQQSRMIFEATGRPVLSFLKNNLLVRESET